MKYHNSGLPLVSLQDLRDPTHEVNTSYRQELNGVRLAIAEDIVLTSGVKITVDVDTPWDDCPVYRTIGKQAPWVCEANRSFHVEAYADKPNALTGHETTLYPFANAPHNVFWAVNFNGSNFVRIPEWRTTGEVRITGTAFNPHTNEKVDVSTLVTKDTIGLGFTGQIYDIRMMDCERPHNSRYYYGMLSEYSEEANPSVPTTTVFGEETGQNGTVVGTNIYVRAKEAPRSYFE